MMTMMLIEGYGSCIIETTDACVQMQTL